MNKLAEKITDSELEVMQVLWDAARPLSVTEIRRELQQRRSWESTTVKTLIQRLYAKGVLDQEKREMYYYTPLISRGEYSDYANKSFIDRLYRGSAKNLVAALVESNGLSEEDMAELRSLFHVEGSHE